MDRVDIKVLLDLVLKLQSINERILIRNEILHTNYDGIKELFKLRNNNDMLDIRKMLSDIISQAEEMKAHLPQ